jgi:uncharacterized membrane protein YgdD (TMEM256/DUF423 family)
MGKTILMIASVLLALAVSLGAFGAHGLKSQLSTDMLQTYKTGVEYHFYHALGLVLIGILAVSYPSELMKWSAILISAGIVLFSGSLYVLAVSGNKMAGGNNSARRIEFYCRLGVAVFNGLEESLTEFNSS